MKVERKLNYPVSARQLVDILTDKAFFAARFEMSAIENYHFDTFEKVGDELVIRVRQEVSLRPGNVPVFARKFIGNAYSLMQEYIWTETECEPYHAHYRFAVGNAPVDVSGSISVTDHDGKAQQIIRVNVTSSVPLIGNKIAALVAEKVESGLDSTYRGTMRYIEERILS
ncbi:MAG: DUF2505 domain-containing protein [Gammaproteobacteria bacterium]|jgi:hypothetical protein|nr:DUF2505 domain-containing protein [Gammaproteobacteria bacterium]MBQ0774046.1 DUF2505 domain-containing protein [Gammaproteobacteria bacterium]